MMVVWVASRTCYLLHLLSCSFLLPVDQTCIFRINLMLFSCLEAVVCRLLCVVNVNKRDHDIDERCVAVLEHPQHAISPSLPVCLVGSHSKAILKYAFIRVPEMAK
jgi:hypothetical protein